jgi:2',3'-cyclic-nucleotide 2'-phosphodiesterase (5'-nucleotidase family)
MGPSLRIVSVNDVYTLENLPRLRSLVRHHAETSPADAMLVVMAGDFLAPSLLSSLDAGRAMVECLNAIGVTDVVLGNHEDDIPVAELRKRIAELRATWLATNVRFDPPLPTSRIVTIERPGRRAVRVGLLGVVMTDATVYRDAPFGGAALAPPNEAALREAARLAGERRCACVVPITHQPLDDDRALARAPRPAPFPVIVGGHEHVPCLEQVERTWIVKAGMDAEQAAIIDLVWPEQPPSGGAADAPTVTVRLDPVSGYPEDAPLRALVAARMAKVHALEGATLLTLSPGERLSSVGSRARQTSMGTLVCSRVRDAFGAEACLFNGGGIRGSREYTSRFTYGDLRTEVPFDNEVVVARLPGSVLRDAVAASRAHAPVESGGFLQVDDGMRVDEASHRVTHVAGAPLDPARDYRVAIVRELLLGMDHIEPLVAFGREHPERVPPAGSGREIKLVLVESFARSLWRQLGGFAAIDADHDGVVTEAEIEAALARSSPAASSPITAQLVLGALDASHDGVVSREEARDADGGDGTT